MNPRSLFLRKLTTDPADSEGHGGGLKRTLGAFDLTMLGIGAIIGAGLFSSIKEMIVGRFDADGAVVAFGAGPAVMISYALTAIACGFAALCYAEISAMVPVSGSAYSYSYAAFGELIAWIIGWDLIIEYAIGNVFVAQSWGDYCQSFLQGLFHWQMPIWLTKDLQSAAALASDPQYAGAFPRLFGHPVAFNLPAFAITIALTWLLYVGIRESARANTCMVILKLSLVGAFIALGAWTIFRRGETHWQPFAPNGVKGVWQGAALGFFSYIGFDAVSTASEETRDPQKALPRGLIGSLLICTVLYILTAAVLTGVVPSAEMTTNDPLAEVMKRMGFTNFATVFAFGAMVAMTAVLLVFQLGQTRIFMVMARDGLLPSTFAKIHPKHQTPHVSTWVTGIVVALACSILTPDQAIGLTNIGTLFAFILVSIGVIVLRRRVPDQHRPFKVPWYPLTPIISALACLGLILGLERSNWLRLVIWLQLGLLLYFTFGYLHSTLRQRAAALRRPMARPAPLTMLAWLLVAAALVPWIFQKRLFEFASIEHPRASAFLLIGWAALSTMLEMAGLGLLRGMRWGRGLLRFPVWACFVVVAASLCVAHTLPILVVVASAALVCVIAVVISSSGSPGTYLDASSEP